MAVTVLSVAETKISDDELVMRSTKEWRGMRSVLVIGRSGSTVGSVDLEETGEVGEGLGGGFRSSLLLGRHVVFHGDEDVAVAVVAVGVARLEAGLIFRLIAVLPLLILRLDLLELGLGDKLVVVGLGVGHLVTDADLEEVVNGLVGPGRLEDVVDEFLDSLDRVSVGGDKDFGRAIGDQIDEGVDGNMDGHGMSVAQPARRVNIKKV